MVILVYAETGICCEEPGWVQMPLRRWRALLRRSSVRAWTDGPRAWDRAGFSSSLPLREHGIPPPPARLAPLPDPKVRRGPFQGRLLREASAGPALRSRGLGTVEGGAALGGELGPGCGQEPPGSTRLTSGPSARTSLSVPDGGRVFGGGREKAAQASSHSHALLVGGGHYAQGAPGTGGGGDPRLESRDQSWGCKGGRADST